MAALVDLSNAPHWAPRQPLWTLLTDMAPKLMKAMKAKAMKADAKSRMASMSFASIYPLYIKKVESKGRSKQELLRVMKWLTGFGPAKIQQLVKEKVTFETFFKRAALNPKAKQIKGVICGCRIEEIQDPLSRKVRYLDKLVDELAKGWPLEKILR